MRANDVQTRDTPPQKPGRYEQNAAAIAWCNEQGILPLSRSQLLTWQRFLPQTFKLGGAHHAGDWSWARYESGLPLEIQGLLSELHDVFPKLEIRGLEQRSKDVYERALFGHIKHPNDKVDVVLIKRWTRGKRSPIREDEIKRIVAARHTWIRYFLFGFPARMTAYLVGLAAITMFLWWLGALTFWWSALGVTLWSAVFLIDKLVHDSQVHSLSRDQKYYVQ